MSLLLASLLGCAAAPDNLHFLDASTGTACLDGSPYAINVLLAEPPSNASWTLSFEGGGWCFDEDDCADRAKTHLGSSTLFPRFRRGFGGCMRFDPASGAPRLLLDGDTEGEGAARATEGFDLLVANHSFDDDVDFIIEKQSELH